MNIAVIDLGTNTFNLLIAEIFPDGKFKIIYSNKLSVRLGKEGIGKNHLHPEAIDRGLKALSEYKNIINQHQINDIHAIATSAIREAVNGTDFIEKARELGFTVSVVSGEKEAELIYKGVQMALHIGEKPTLIMDIGGGSTEFIIADSKKIYWKKSFLLGVTRLLDKFKPSDPITRSEIHQLYGYLKEQLRPLKEAYKQFPFIELIGSSGSFDSFADIIEHRHEVQPPIRKKTEYEFNFEQVDVLFDELIRSTKEQRLNVKGLIKMRVDMIVMAVLLTKFILDEYEISKMRLSTYALKEGVLSQFINKK